MTELLTTTTAAELTMQGFLMDIGAALVIATFPTLLFYLFLSRKIQESFIAGAVKG